MKVIRLRRGPDPDLLVQLADGTHAAIAMSGTDYAAAPEPTPAAVLPLHLLALDGLAQAAQFIECLRRDGLFPEADR